MTEPEPRRKVLEDADRDFADWQSSADASFSRGLQPSSVNHVLTFRTAENANSCVRLELDHVLDLTMQVDLKLMPNSSLTVTLRSRDTDEEFYLHYIASDLHISAQKEHTYHGVGRSVGWVRITRDLVVDVTKGSLFQNKHKRKIARSKIKVNYSCMNFSLLIFVFP